MKKTYFLTMLTAALMGSAYANTNYTATPGTDCTPPGYVYGSYADTGEASGGSVEFFEVAAPEGYEYLNYVYGGYVQDTGEASGNTVTMNGGLVYYVYGGSAYSSGNVSENEVTINGGYVYNNVFGGFTISGGATSNTVTMNDGQVNYVYGGYVDESGSATYNTVTMNDGHVYSDVYGGYVQDTGEASYNTVTMNDGQVSYVYGGYVQDTGEASGNTVTMNGGYVYYDVFGGSVQSTGDATENAVTINDGYVDYNVFGGYTYSGKATGNTVTISGGQVGRVYGANSSSGVVSGNTATVSGGRVDILEGGFSRDGIASANTVTVSDGQVGAVFAGGSQYGNAENNTVTISGGEVELVYGGQSAHGNAENNVAYILGGKIGSVIGGSSQGGSANGNTVVLSGGEVAGGVVAGQGAADGASDNHVYLVGKGASVEIGGQTYTGSAQGVKVGGVVSAGQADGGATLSNNTIEIYGTGIFVQDIYNADAVNYHITESLLSTAAPMVTVTTQAGDFHVFFPLSNFIGDKTTDWTAFAGQSITLMQSELPIVIVTETDVDITDGEGKVLGTATLQLTNDAMTLLLTFKGEIPVPPPAPIAGPDALDVALVNSLWASSAYVREFVRLSEAQGYALKDGDTSVWGGGFGTFMHVTGDKGFKSDGGGYGIGVNHAFSANTQAGISLGQGFGSYHNSGADGATVHQRAILAAATASTRIGKDLSIGAHLAYGNVRNRADCHLDGAPTERARWNDNVFNLGARAAYDFHATDATAITPFLGLDWMYGAQESINGAYARHYSHGRLNELRMPVGVTVSTSAEVGSTKLLPQLSVAYVPSLAQQLPHADVSGENGDYRVKGYAPGRNAFMLNAGVNAVFSDSWSAGAFYTLETRRHCVDQSVNASVRYTF